jgi:hypothetical protein
VIQSHKPALEPQQQNSRLGTAYPQHLSPSARSRFRLRSAAANIWVDANSPVKSYTCKRDRLFRASQKKKVSDSGQTIEEATAESSEKVTVIKQLLSELSSIVEQNGRLNDGPIETRSTSIVINKT